MQGAGADIQRRFLDITLSTAALLVRRHPTPKPGRSK